MMFSWRVSVAVLTGYCVGNLPDHGVVWALIKLAFTLAVFILTVRLARREWAAQRRLEGRGA